MLKFSTSYAIGAFLILAGFFLPSQAIVDFLRITPGNLLQQLLLGAKLFKIGLVILGIFVMTLGRMSIRRLERQGGKGLPNPDNKFIPIILAAIMIAAFFLRLYGLSYGLWYDEILTYLKYMKMPFGEIITTYDDQNQHFLYTVMAHASFRVFGESAWSVRLPAVLFGVGSIWALFVFGRQVSNALEALLASAMLAFSYHHLWFSQNARGYTGILFFTILASWLFLRGLHEGRRQFWLLYAIVAALGAYTHMTMLFVVMGHLIIYFMRLFGRRKEVWPNRWTGFLLGFCLAGLFTLQLYSFVLPQIFGGTLWQGAGSTVTEWKNPLWTLVELAKGIKIGFAGTILAISALIIFVVGLIGFARTKPIFVQLLIIPAIIGGVLTVLMGHPLWPRFFFFTIGFNVLIIIRGTMLFGHITTRLLNFAPSKSVPIGATFCLVLIMVSAVSISRAYAPKQDYVGALNFVEARKEPGDAIVTIGVTAYTYREFFKMDWEDIETLESLNFIRSRAKRTWLLFTFPPHVQSVYPEIYHSIQRDFKLIKQFYGTVGGGTIVVCRSDIPGS